MSLLKKLLSKSPRLLKYLKNVLRKFDSIITYRNYRRLKFKNTTIKNVVFLVSESQKWNGDSLYWELNKSNDFNPLIVVTPLSRHTNEDYGVCLTFMKNQGYRVEEGIDPISGKAIKLSRFNPFFVFYQQPWGLMKVQSLINVSKIAYTGYFPYSILVANNSKHYDLDFFRDIYQIYVDSNITFARFKRVAPWIINKCIITGHPKLDNLPKDCSSKTTVIFAPHHSFESDRLNYATFEWSGNVMHRLAKENPQIEFVLKPHPRFEFAVVKNSIMTKDEYDQYMKDWYGLPNCSIYNQGNYFKLFAESTHMITDCGSFLAEYFVMKKPLILLQKPLSKGYSELGEYVLKNAYKVNNDQELIKVFEDLIIRGNDTKYRERLKQVDVFSTKISSAGKILKSLREIGLINE